MAKIDIISGFLGAGKTTLIQKLLKEALKGEKVVLIENEFGEIGIDGGFLKDAGIEVTEMNSGCICCSLVGDFGSALKEVVTQYNPDRIIIEPSGVGKLSDVIKAVQGVAEDVELDLNSFVTVADAKKCKMYIKNFGEFYNNQVEYAGSIILSRTGDVAEDKLNESVALLREHNEKAAIITTPWDELSGEQILKVMEDGNDMVKELLDNDFYIGTFRLRKRARNTVHGKDKRVPKEEQCIFEDHHPAIIDKATFSLVQELKEKRNRTNYRGSRGEWIGSEIPNPFGSCLFL